METTRVPAAVHQNGSWQGAAVPGVAEAGDGFGAALGWRSSAGDMTELVVGAPGEDLTSGPNAGMLASFGVGAEHDGTMSSVTESSYAGGHSEAGDRFGATLASGEVAASAAATQAVSVLGVGIPGEDVKGVADAGAVATILESSSARFATLGGGPVKGLRYGSVVAGFGD